MTDRDFKLLVREYFQAKSKLSHSQSNTWEDVREGTKRMRELERRILSELEDFTRRDVEELPFKEKEI